MTSKSDLHTYLHMLLCLETGQQTAATGYEHLRQLYEHERTRLAADHATAAATGPDAAGPALCGVTLPMLRHHLATFYGRGDAWQAGTDELLHLSFADWARLVERRCWLPLCCAEMDWQGVAMAAADYAFCHTPDHAARALRLALNTLLQDDRRPFHPLPPEGPVDRPVLHLMHFLLRTTARADAVCRAIALHRLATMATEAAQGTISPARHDALLRRVPLVLEWALVGSE